MRIIYSCF